jgi:cell division septal protein FtsQ
MKAQLKSERVQAHELVRKRRGIGALFLAVSTGAFCLFLLINQFTATAVVRADDITMPIDEHVYERVVQDYLGSRPAERLRFLLDTKELNDFVKATVPEVSSVRVEGWAGLGKSAFTFTMRRPIAGWSVNGGQQYVDDSGVSFAKNYFPQPSVQIVDKSGIPAVAGQAIASNHFLEFVGLVVGLAKAQGYTVTSVIIPEHTTRQVQLQLKDVSYPVKFSVDRRAGEQVEDMARAIKWFVSKSVVPEYLDVRVANKAFYKQ